MVISVSPRSNECEEDRNDCAGKRQKKGKQVSVATEPPSVELPGKRRSARMKTDPKIGNNETEVAVSSRLQTTAAVVHVSLCCICGS